MDRSAVLNVNEVENRSPTERPPASLTTDRLLDTLANAHRRRVVRRLFERDAPVPFERLVDDLATTQAAETGEADREAVRIALHHTHLPKLVDDGVVTFDREESIVEPGPQLRVVAACLDALERTRERVR
ncbi:DUF7344 domain-containing protein [Halalkalicoccus ordinarius]|uniref:DUF7344 domain-containing protein n=1 Tax=Halalkalicoccus ordinarius TaxID=3116651 RepID=UPI00300F2BD4